MRRHGEKLSISSARLSFTHGTIRGAKKLKCKRSTAQTILEKKGTGKYKDELRLLRWASVDRCRNRVNIDSPSNIPYSIDEVKASSLHTRWHFFRILRLRVESIKSNAEFSKEDWQLGRGFRERQITLKILKIR
jgi:hypothetical protein